MKHFTFFDVGKALMGFALSKYASRTMRTMIVPLLILVMGMTRLYAVGEIEQNDSPGQANSLTSYGLPVTVTGLLPSGDEDWFKIQPTQGVLTVTVSVSSVLQLGIRVYDATGTNEIVCEVVPAPGITGSLNALIPVAGDYYIQVYNYNGNNGTYTINASLDVSDIYEYNNSHSSTMPALTLPANITAKIKGYEGCYFGQSTDQDWFRVNLTQKGVLSVITSNVPSTVQLGIRIYDASGNNQIVCEAIPVSGFGTTLDALIPAVGNYYIQIFSNNGVTSNSTYTMNVSFDTSNEYNNDPVPTLPITSIANNTLYPKIKGKKYDANGYSKNYGKLITTKQIY